MPLLCGMVFGFGSRRALSRKRYALSAPTILLLSEIATVADSAFFICLLNKQNRQSQSQS